jgi:hypothetical protein
MVIVPDENGKKTAMKALKHTVLRGIITGKGKTLRIKKDKSLHHDQSFISWYVAFETNQLRKLASIGKIHRISISNSSKSEHHFLLSVYSELDIAWCMCILDEIVEAGYLVYIDTIKEKESA